MTVRELIAALSLETLCAGDLDRPVSGGYCGDLLSRVMGRAQPGDVWLTIMGNRNMVAVAVLTEVSAVLLAEGVVPEEEALRRAETEGVTVLRSEKSVYALCAALAALRGAAQ